MSDRRVRGACWKGGGRVGRGGQMGQKWEMIVREGVCGKRWEKMICRYWYMEKSK